MNVHAELAHRHYVAVTFPIGKDGLADAARAFLDFLQLDTPVLRALHFASTVERGTADGYTDKWNEKGKDPKQFFHWTPRIVNEQSYQCTAAEHPSAQDFFDRAAQVYAYAERTAVHFFREHFEPHILQQIAEGGRLRRASLRFLAYSTTAQQFSAQPHYDKSFGTLALAESSQGLRIGCCREHEMHEVEHRDGTAIFMPGWKLFETTRKMIIPAWHDVVHETTAQPVRYGIARWAIVFFVDDPHGYPGWDAVHTPVH